MASIRFLYATNLVLLFFMCEITSICTLQSKVAQQISTTVPRDFAVALNVVYFPQLGTRGIAPAEL